MSKSTLPVDSWVLRKFPDLDPVSIVRGRDVSRQQLNRQEYDRAIWMWNRRTSEVNWLRLLLVLGIGALAHLPLIVLADPLIFCIYHILYIGIVLACIGYFMRKEAKLRRWKQDYLRSLARMIEPPNPRAR